jgi:PAS domain S-box-containing protein
MQGYIFLKKNPLLLNKGYLEVDNYLSLSKDLFISSVIAQLHMDEHHYEIYYNGRIFHTVKMPLYDSFKNEIGQIVFLQEATFFHNELVWLILKSAFLYIVSIFIIYWIFNSYIDRLLKRLSRSDSILSQINDSVIILDPISGTIIQANQRAETTLKYDSKELIGKNVADIKESMSEKNSSSWQQRVNELQSKQSITTKTFSIRKDGTRFPIEANLTYLKTNYEDIIVSVGRDITLQMEQEAELKRQHNEMERLNELISESVLYTTADLDGNITYISRAFEKFTGYSSKEVLGKNHRLFKHKDTPPQFFEEMWKIIENNQPFYGELKNRRKDGSAYWTKLTIKPIFNKDGEKIGYASYRQDISDKKELGVCRIPK